MKQQRNVILILGIGLFVGIGNAQMKDMNHEHQSDSTHQMKVQEDESMKMHDHESMKMQKTTDMEKGGEVIVYYTCPMESHKHIHSSEPGKCPECGMKMVEAVLTDVKEADFYGCPMPSHSHVRSEKTGNCNECGMELKPMKLKNGKFGKIRTLFGKFFGH